MNKESYLRRTNLKGGKLVIGQDIRANTYGVSGMSPKFFSCDSIKLRIYIKRLMKLYGLKNNDFGKLLKLVGLKPPFEAREFSEVCLSGVKKVKYFKVRQGDNTEFYMTFDENALTTCPDGTDFVIIKDVPYNSLENTIFNKIYNYYHIEVKERDSKKEILYTVYMTKSCIISSPEEGFEQISLTYSYTNTSINFVKKIKRTKDSSRIKYRFKVKVASKKDAPKLYTNIDVLEAYFACIHEDLVQEKEIDNLLNIMEFTNKDILKTEKVLYGEIVRDANTLEKKERCMFDYESEGDKMVFKVHFPGYPIDTVLNARSIKYFEEDENFLLEAAAQTMISSENEFDQRLLSWCILNKKKYSDIVNMLERLGFEGNILLTYIDIGMVYKVESEDDEEIVIFGLDGKIQVM